MHPFSTRMPRTNEGEGDSLSVIVLGKLHIYIQRNELGRVLVLQAYTKITQKWIKNLTVRHETVKLLGGNREED